ncbi:hypothetical protein B0J13DRAFT_61313 [Dactylonectria estremocensis]|uniref:F-box domain-containing protein n=1 Tax=Dactylonectria estremocensis TaxID=1079267 RepID=A0A9P9IZX1_9HYPO|nr:hypothetical protein B0J13DRAFT_61313 [Dactylonectria estremocensis]
MEETLSSMEDSSPSLIAASTASQPSTTGCRLLTLPPELIDTIICHLPPFDVASLSMACQTLREHALSDVIWHPLVQENVPGLALTSPAPCASYHELYAAHHLVWFLPRYKIWFSDRELMGKLIIVRYDPRRGCIEGYQLLAGKNRTTYQHWPAHHHVFIHGFEPRVALHLDKPVIQFRIKPPGHDGGFSKRPGANRFADEIPMELDDRFGAMFSNFLLARPLDPDVADVKLTSDYPYGNIWPPPALPARQHISGGFEGRDRIRLEASDRPQCRSQISDQTFRIRHWLEMAGSPRAPGIVLAPPGSFDSIGVGNVLRGMQFENSLAGGSGLTGGMTGIHLGEEVISYSTVNPALYTPTALKPWRGIWVGDYSGHGCEFLLIHQPDDPPATDDELGLERTNSETDQEWEARRTDARIYRGRLEAIKLTGDPNVPRGEHTFIVDDLGPGGHVGDATDPPFAGVRMVRSQGHVAETDFIGDNFIDSQLFLISHDRLAQYWVGGHISFFERVDVDKFLRP